MFLLLGIQEEEKEDMDMEIAAFGNRVNGDCGKVRRRSNSDHCFEAIARMCYFINGF